MYEIISNKELPNPIEELKLQCTETLIVSPELKIAYQNPQIIRSLQLITDRMHKGAERTTAREKMKELMIIEKLN